MSRIGKMPIKIPKDVEVKIDGSKVFVKGPKGSLERNFVKNIKIEKVEDEIKVSRLSDDKVDRSLHGLVRSLINNMIIGVTAGFKKDLEINGVGYRAQKQGKNLVLSLGYSHQVVMPEIEGITIDVKDQTSLSVSGIDKQKVGQFAAEIRSKRPPEPYKGKGIKYVDEVIRRKMGKAGKGSKG